MSRDKLFEDRMEWDYLKTVKDTKALIKEVKICDHCDRKLDRVVTHGTNIVCSVECGYKISGNEPFIERESILEEQKRKYRRVPDEDS